MEANGSKWKQTGANGGKWKQTEANGGKRRRFIVPGNGVPTFSVTKDKKAISSSKIHADCPGIKPFFSIKKKQLSWQKLLWVF